MARDLDAGASWVIAEGRESGTVGLYQADQGVREDLVSAILGRIPQDKVIFEAPGKSQQAWFVRQLGAGRQPRQRRARPACCRWKRCGSGCARTPPRPAR